MTTPPASTGPDASPGPGEAADPPPETAVPLQTLLVVGSGRSGTSTLAGALKRLGMHVPQPEVPADNSNPRGFSEPRWVVRRHDRLLQRANVTVGDARPQAWLATAEAGLQEKTRQQVYAWLTETCTLEQPEVVLKDPRLGWFLDLWRTAAIRAGIATSYALMLRPPAETVASKQAHYSANLTPTARAAGWVNHMLHVERATRGERRAFLHYHQLLEDWTVPVFALGEKLDLHTVQTASAKDILQVHEFIDPSLRRITTEQHALDIPHPLDEIVDATWEQLCRLEEGETPEVHARLDELREQYTELYRHAEELTISSAQAARREGIREQKADAAAAADVASSAEEGPRGLRRGRGRGAR